MNKILFIVIFSLFYNLSASAQLTTVGSLPSVLNEASGVLFDDSVIWVHNDNNSILYKVDTNLNLLDTFWIDNSINFDVEDITRDNMSNWYVGDFGNNNHNRQNLRIYKFKHPNMISGKHVNAGIINFTYSDQNQFPDPNQNSDCEGMIWYQDSIYLFSKNWGTTGYTKLYVLPDDTGTHVAQLIDSFFIGTTQLDRVTSAAISPQGRLALLTYSKIFTFENYTNHFFDGLSNTYNIAVTQKEGVDFKNENQLYIVDEIHNILGGGNLYQFQLMASNSSINEIDKDNTFLVYPNPAKEKIIIKNNNPQKPVEYIKLYNLKGEVIIEKTNPVTNQVDITALENGVYIVQINQSFYKLIKQ